MDEIEIDLAIANRVLSLTLSTVLLNSIDEENKESVTIKQFYGQVLKSLQKQLFLGFNKRSHYFVAADILETDTGGVVWYRLPSDWLITRRIITNPQEVSSEGYDDIDYAERTDPHAIGFASGCIPQGVVYSFFNRNSNSWDVDFVEVFEHSLAGRMYASLARVYDSSYQTYLNDKANELIGRLRVNSSKNEGNPRKNIRSAYPNDGLRPGVDSVFSTNAYIPIRNDETPPTRAGE